MDRNTNLVIAFLICMAVAAAAMVLVTFDQSSLPATGLDRWFRPLAGFVALVLSAAAWIAAVKVIDEG